jgi:hypothetical protein
MKTYQEMFEDVVNGDFVTENVTPISPEERAAKAYAKQWAYEAIHFTATKIKGTIEMADVIKFMDKIDTHQ